MLRRPRARASLPHTRSGRSGGGRGRGGPRPRPRRGGAGRDAEEGRRGSEAESGTKGCAGCHRAVAGGRFVAPRTPRMPLPGVRPRGVGGGWDVREGEAGAHGCLLRVGGGSAPRGARRGSVFLVPVRSSPFFVALVSWSFVTVCIAVVEGASSRLGSPGGGLPSVGGERECLQPPGDEGPFFVCRSLMGCVRVRVSCAMSPRSFRRG